MVKANGIFENRFTGWKDVGLTENGINEAIFSAEQINQQIFQLNQ